MSEVARERRREAVSLSLAERVGRGVNREGRPRGVPRMHINRWGEPKPCLTRENAVAMALAHVVDQEQFRPVDPYQCDYCGWWHIGTRRPELRKTIDRQELGERAWWNLWVENTGSLARRLSVVARRFHRQGREAIDPGNKAAKLRRQNASGPPAQETN